MSGIRLEWKTPGPVADAFLSSRDFVDALMGPVGAAKTTTALVRHIDMAQEQRPSPRDGHIHFKACVITKTYRTLWKNLLPSWWNIVPKETGTWHGSDGGPGMHRIPFQRGDGPIIQFHADFIAIGENRAEDVLRGYEPTVFLIEEADLHDFDVFQYCVTRCGRFPKMIDGGPSYRGVTLIFNAPDTDNWTYKVCVEQQTPEGKPIGALSYVDRETGETIRVAVRFFRQPSGMSPAAENLHNLPSGYYEAQMMVLEGWLADRMVHNKFGYSRDGMPVYKEFNDGLFVAADELAPIRGLPLILGLDGGGSPAAVVKQHRHDGQWRTLDEICTEHGTGPERFGDALNRLLSDRYAEWAVAQPRHPWEATGGDFRAILAAADPSCFYGDDKQSENDRAWAYKVQKVTGLTLRAAPTNALLPRLSAVRQSFRLIDGHVPGYLLSPRCPVLRKAYNSHYRYMKIKAPGAARYAVEPEKNNWSHVADADQYAQLTFGETYATEGRTEARRNVPRPAQAEMD